MALEQALLTGLAVEAGLVAILLDGTGGRFGEPVLPKRLSGRVGGRIFWSWFAGRAGGVTFFAMPAKSPSILQAGFQSFMPSRQTRSVGTSWPLSASSLSLLELMGPCLVAPFM
jgi:hypothetical protein